MPRPYPGDSSIVQVGSQGLKGATGPAGMGLLDFIVGSAFGPTRLCSLATTDETPTKFDATPVTNSSRLNQPANSSAQYVGTVIGRVRATGKSWQGYFLKRFTRVATAPVADAAITIRPDDNNPAELSGLDGCVDVVADGTAGDLVGQATGLAGTPIDWTFMVTQTGIASPTAPTISGPAPTITSVTPSIFPLGGASNVPIVGTNFVTGAQVSVDGVTFTPATFNSATSLTATIPAHSAGSGTLTVRNPDQQTATHAVTFVAAPTLTLATPSHGPTGTSVSLDGTNLSNTSNVKFVGGSDFTSLVNVSGTNVTATSPAQTAGAATIRLTTPGGTADIAFTVDAGAPPWSPPVPPLAYWKISDVTTLTVGSNQVSNATDQGSNGHDLVQASPGNQFGYSGAGQINAINVLKHLGSSKMVGGAITALNDFTIVMVVKAANSVGTDRPMFALGSFNPAFYVKDQKIAMYLGGYYQGAIAVTDGTSHVLTWKRSGSTLTMYVDGVAETPATVSSGVTGSTLNFGFDGSVTFGDGLEADALIFDTALSDANRGNVEAHLKVVFATP